MTTELIELEGKFIEVYIRFNDDNEKDYCFNVKSTATFGELDEIFKTLPMSLNPSIFSKHIPKGYAISRFPGHLTPEGGLLFSADASKAKFLEPKGRSELVIENVWPGQLIVPIWEWNNPVYYGVVGLLSFWLWTDLPDFITPTPYLRLSRNAILFGGYVLEHVLGNPAIGASMREEALSESSFIAQCIFFCLQLLKFAFIILILYVGAFNPYSYNPFNQKKIEVTREQLLSIGWTSSRRATIEEFSATYREKKIAAVGGIIQASKTGVLESLRDNGVTLGKGEGFDTKIPEKGDKPISLELMRKLNKFTLNYEYTELVGQFFEDSLEGKTQEDQAKAIKDFRKFGPLSSPPQIKELYIARKMLGPGDVAEE
ncbi:unnamed protein product [Kuraishia capsulata CBS 1993]|uniref:Uncharacterized protein n=1 Tax=Kuraishia capsulata CBS 1993 TaxID=1382522 RepID=W6MWD7_9ASCO|nr:uncharacterized protein KUCA_T00003243001 [Kuraishia capsulata CBS 1993]CDK27265.1 unnamed protein product [Kuraishia capsulata CBS 1993]